MSRLRRCWGWLCDWRPALGVVADLRARAPHYADDWLGGLRHWRRLLAPITYIFLASLLPAIAFGEQLRQNTDAQYGVAQVLVADAIGGVAQSVVGGQPLLIVGVAQPMVLIYTFAFEYLDGRGRSDLFRPVMSIVLFFASGLHALVALANWCQLVRHFTRFAGETFGFLIAVLFVTDAIRGLVHEFQAGTSGVQFDTGVPEGEESAWRLINGLWSLILAGVLVALAVALLGAEKWRVGRKPLRRALAAYGPLIAVVAVTGLSYAVGGAPGGADVPTRVDAQQVYESPAKDSWSTLGELGNVSGEYIGFAFGVAILVTVLDFFDHNVSAALAQQPEFGLRKGTTYSYDFLLQAVMFAVFGLCGLPPTNCVVPQAPLHTRALAVTQRRKGKDKTKAARAVSRQRFGSRALGSISRLFASSADDLSDNVVVEADEENTPTAESTSTGGASAAATTIEAGANGAPSLATVRNVEIRVYEQRVSNLCQSLAIFACCFLAPALRLIPRAAIWAYFFLMGIESLPGMQLSQRLVLLATDPKLRRGAGGGERVLAFLDTVRWRTIVLFTCLQLAAAGAAYAITWVGGIVGLLFPLLIMALVPFRWFVLPRLFPPQEVDELDRSEALEEVVEAVPAALASERAAEAAHPPVGSLLGADSGLAGHGAGFLQVPHVVRESELRRRHGRAVDIRSGAEPGTPQAAPQ